MHFIAPDEARLLEKQLRHQIADRPKPKLVLYYRSARRDYADATRAIAASIGEFTDTTLHFSFCVSGDGWSEGNDTNERWSRYRRWRGANGEHRWLYEAPGHQFGPHEAE